MNKTYKISMLISYGLALVMVSIGLHKMFVYENDRWDTVNVYVGGDAYNYIINANYSTSFFTLALLFTVLGSTFLIADKLSKGE